MSNQEETLLEPTEEIEEIEEFDQSEEIDENSEYESETGSNVLISDDIDLDEFEDHEDDTYMMDMGGLLSSVLATEEGDTVCSALVNISRQMEVQNKILIKMLSQMQKN